MLENFGEKVKELRIEKNITREELCGDETELSIRQLARIELGQSIPTLSKVMFIAKVLDVSVGFLTDGAELEVPKRYKELKYLILRTPTYMDDHKLKIREQQFDEIFEDYYDQLPEEEKIVVDCLQSKFDIYQSGDINFGSALLKEYLIQISKKEINQVNDLLIIDLYLTCAIVSSFDRDFFDVNLYNYFADTIVLLEDRFQVEDLFLLNNLLLTCSGIAVKLGIFEKVTGLMKVSHTIMTKIQDFQKMPIYCMYLWKYHLHLEDKVSAKAYFEQAIIFTQMTGDAYLGKQLRTEWQKDYVV
ncbi:helix-turn-helix domain-containing protein [Streptococcus phocae]|uniref:Cro/Cl family transcriptional regulator n=1 Tax=Streptococcus phocae TaxID=119224 RepID=A0A0N8FXJ2_9STRE|nr:XRE family transcriptional regulator [Streptococcus phocae]KPJ23283.1 Cro/Cl family transcriptional regulator [Streptococcus phocae]